MPAPTPPQICKNRIGTDRKRCFCHPALQALGFNCVRLPFSFADLYSDPPVNQDNFISDCPPPTVQQVARGLTPPQVPVQLAGPASSSNSSGAASPLQQLLSIAANTSAGQLFPCNAAFNASGPATVDRLIYAASAIAQQGMYVVIANELTIDPLAVINPPVGAAAGCRAMLSMPHDAYSCRLHGGQERASHSAVRHAGRSPVHEPAGCCQEPMREPQRKMFCAEQLAPPSDIASLNRTQLRHEAAQEMACRCGWRGTATWWPASQQPPLQLLQPCWWTSWMILMPMASGLGPTAAAQPTQTWPWQLCRLWPMSAARRCSWWRWAQQWEL